MKDRKFMAALAVGVLSGLLAFGWMASKINNYKKRSTLTLVWVTTVFVPAHSALQSNQVVKKEIPAEFVSPSAIQDIRDVEGLVTLAPLSAGEQVQANEFGYPNNNLVLTLPKGARAFTLSVNDVTGLGGLLEPGDHVDILAHLETSQKQLTATALQNILVLATGDQTSRSSANTSSSSTTNSSGYGTVTVAVSPEQAELLAFLEEHHPLRLVLRAPGDDAVVALPPQSAAEMVGKIGSFARPHEKGLEVIRGIQNLEQGQ